MTLKTLVITGFAFASLGIPTVLGIASAAAQTMRGDGYYVSHHNHSSVAHSGYARGARDRDYYDKTINNFDWPYGKGVSH